MKAENLGLCQVPVNSKVLKLPKWNTLLQSIERRRLLNNLVNNQKFEVQWK
jgi:hypothetical protein